MALQDYTRLWIEVDGIRDDQATSIDQETESGLIEVYTIDGGWVGMTPGPGMCTFQIGFAIPAGGMTINYQALAATPERRVTIQMGCGANAYVGEGYVTNCKITQSTKDSTSGTVTIKAERAPIE